MTLWKVADPTNHASRESRRARALREPTSDVLVVAPVPRPSMSPWRCDKRTHVPRRASIDRSPERGPHSQAPQVLDVRTNSLELRKEAEAVARIFETK